MGEKALIKIKQYKIKFSKVIIITYIKNLINSLFLFIYLQRYNIFLHINTNIKNNNTIDRTYINHRAEIILTHYGNSILRLAYSYLHNMHDAEEILQETLIQYLKTSPILENEAYEKAWLFRVASNLSKNRISYNKIRSTDELNESLIAEEREDLSFVWEAVKELPVKYKEVIHLFYYEELSTAEIANILQKKESTVRSHLMRGREKLKSILKEAYDFE